MNGALNDLPACQPDGRVVDVQGWHCVLSTDVSFGMLLSTDDKMHAMIVSFPSKLTFELS